MQHLNFCSQLEKVVEPPLSARQQLTYLIALVVVMLLVYTGLSISSSSLQKEREQLSREQTTLANSVAGLQARKAKLERESTVERDITILKNEIIFRRKLLANIDPNSTVLESGFADHLAGLARQTINGMWFTEIQLHEGGQQLALLGKTNKPEFVPQYLQKLVRESVFSGHEFRVFRLSMPEDSSRLLEFELRAREEAPLEEVRRANGR